MTINFIRFSIISFLFFISCSTTGSIRSDRTGIQSKFSFGNILVLASTDDHSRRIQQQMETTVTDRLLTMGYAATPALANYDRNITNELSERRAIEQLLKPGYDGILTLALHKENGGSLPETPRNFWDYYDSHFNNKAMIQWAPGIADKYYWEISLFETKSLKKIYAETTEPFEFTDPEAMTDSFSNVIAHKLIADSMLKGR